ncbi:redoxin domain-containing protein [Paraliobacillus salinarum]|uniref:redoxin domain-containing protein n=1 Tax=Paraliobacillus salinarum TaxID=1158996 RepID=UPI0031B5816A
MSELKKAIIVLVITGMFGWAIFDLVYDGDKEQNEEITEEEQNYQATDETELIENEESANNDQSSANEIGLNVGNTAPDFTLETLSGDQVSLSDYRGKKVMLNFWATWCPPCRAEMPAMQNFYTDNDVEVLAVNLISTETAKQDVVDFVDSFGLTFSILLDEGNQVALAYGIRPIPTTYMIDTNGVIQKKSFGPMNQEQMEQALTSMN